MEGRAGRRKWRVWRPSPGAAPLLQGGTPAGRPEQLMFNLLQPVACITGTTRTSPAPVPGRIPSIVFPRGPAHLGVPEAGRVGRSPRVVGSLSQPRPVPAPGSLHSPRLPQEFPGVLTVARAGMLPQSREAWALSGAGTELPTCRAWDKTTSPREQLEAWGLTPPTPKTASPPHPKEGWSFSQAPRPAIFRPVTEQGRRECQI